MKICVLGYRVSEVADVVAFLLVVVDTADRAHDVALAVCQSLTFNHMHKTAKNIQQIRNYTGIRIGKSCM